MKNGDKIIWDSGWGYEIGYFIGESQKIYNCYEINLITGIVKGNRHLPKNGINKYSDLLEYRLNFKYGYKR